MKRFAFQEMLIETADTLMRLDQASKEVMPLRRRFNMTQYMNEGSSGVPNVQEEFEKRKLKVHSVVCPAGWYRNSWVAPTCEMCYPGYVSHPNNEFHEWPYRCTSCSIMHAA